MAILFALVTLAYYTDTVRAAPSHDGVGLLGAAYLRQETLGFGYQLDGQPRDRELEAESLDEAEEHRRRVLRGQGGGSFRVRDDEPTPRLGAGLHRMP